MRILRDERGIIVSWILKLLLGFAIFGLALFEAGAIIVSRVAVDRIAIDAAQEGALEYGRSRSTAKARETAERLVERNDAEMIQFEILNRGERALVEVEKTAATLFVHRIPGIRDYTIARAQNTAPVR